MSEVGDITLSSGRVLGLCELRQSLAYEGLLEGLPTREMNARHLSALVGDRRNHIEGQPPHLIVPVQRPIDVADYPFGEPAALPSVVCEARFKSRPVARDHTKDYSALVVIWFQDDFAFPIDTAVVEQLRAMDWDALAADLEY